MHPDWLSNAYLLADEPGGTAVFVDRGAPLEPLHEIVERERLNVTHLLTTHSHPDHVAGDAELVERYGVEIVKGRSRPAAFTIEALPTPGHSPTPRLRRQRRPSRFTGRHPVQGRGRRRSDSGRSALGDGSLMTLPHELRASRPHGRDDDRPRVGGEPVRPASGAAARRRTTSRAVSAARMQRSSSGRPTTTARARRWVRFADGRDAIVGGSRVER